MYSVTHVPAVQDSWGDNSLNNLNEEEMLLVEWHVMGYASSLSKGLVDDSHHSVGKYFLSKD